MKKIITVVVLVLVLALSVATLTACGGDKKSDWEYIESKGEMIIGWTPNAPMAVVSDDDSNTLDKTNPGFDIELAEATAKILGIKIKFEPISWNDQVFELNSRNIDLLWNGLTVLPERIEAYELSKNYLENNQVAVIRTSDKNKYYSIETLKTAGTFIIEGGSAAETIYNDVLGGAGELVTSASQIKALIDLKAKQSDVALVDRTLAEYFCSKNPDCMIVTADGTPLMLNETEYYAIAARKGDTVFINKINDALIQLYNDGTYDRLLEKYNLSDLRVEIK